MASKKEMEDLFLEWDETVKTKRNEVYSHGEGLNIAEIQYAGGLDISFCRQNDEDLVHACVALVVTELQQGPLPLHKEPKVVYQNVSFVHMDLPYISGYLGFREAKWYKEELDHIKETHPEFYPQVLLVDGNGILHHDGFGSACHIGVASAIPTIGVAKQLLHVDGLSKDKIPDVLDVGVPFDLVGETRGVLGKAMRSTSRSTKPIFISVGHKINLNDAADVVHQLCYYREPEPIRQADILSRKVMREDYRQHIIECPYGWLDGSERLGQLDRHAKEIKNENIAQQI